MLTTSLSAWQHRRRRFQPPVAEGRRLLLPQREEEKGESPRLHPRPHPQLHLLRRQSSTSVSSVSTHLHRRLCRHEFRQTFRYPCPRSVQLLCRRLGAARGHHHPQFPSVSLCTQAAGACLLERRARPTVVLLTRPIAAWDLADAVMEILPLMHPHGYQCHLQRRHHPRVNQV